MLLAIQGTEFEKVWRGLKGDVKSQASYIRLLDPTALPAIFKTSLTGTLLASIVNAALHGSVSSSLLLHVAQSLLLARSVNGLGRCHSACSNLEF